MRPFLELPAVSAFGMLLGVFLVTAPVSGSSAPAIDHDLWGEVLEAFVDENGQVDYHGLHESPDTFDQYIEQVENFGPASHPELFDSREDELAYYINTYNALVFKGVLARGPETRSVWRGLISGYNFFVRMDIRVGGEKTNLKSLEDDIIREEFRDPRIHAALNCASIGCPRLIRQPFLGATLDEQLQDAMIGFLNDERHVLVDSESGVARISKIFDWFDEDFLEYEADKGNTGGSEAERLLHYINRFRPESRQIPADYRVEFLKYDKAINSR